MTKRLTLDGTCAVSLARPERRTHDPVIRPDRPWEGRAAGLWSSVLYDREAGVYKCWYRSADDDVEAASDRNVLNYAVSDDGVMWEKPDLNAVEWRGSRRNNIVYWPHDSAGLRAFESHGVIVDEVGAPERRYKLLAYHAFETNQGNGIYGFVQPGRHPLESYERADHAAGRRPSLGHEGSGFRPLPCLHTPSKGDRRGVLSAIPEAEVPNEPLGSRMPYKRLITRATSSDFLSWSDFENVLRMDDWDTPGTQFYSISPFAYGIAIWRSWISTTRKWRKSG